MREMSLDYMFRNEPLEAFTNEDAYRAIDHIFERAGIVRGLPATKVEPLTIITPGAHLLVPERVSGNGSSSW